MIRDITLTVRTITPLHIGTGRTLTRDFDFVTKGGRTYRIHEEGLIDELYARDPKLTEQLMRTPPGRLLKPEDLTDGSPFVRYVLPGVPGSSEFREQIKDPRDQPYIPGSTLKGALRTVIAWHGWKEEGLRLSMFLSNWKSRRTRSKYAASFIERRIFGSDPHHDFLRALRIADSEPIAQDALVIENVNVWTKRGTAAPISIEAIKEGTEFEAKATIDEALFSSWAAKTGERGYPLPHRDWICAIPKLARARAAERIKRELLWWKGNPTPSKLHDIERALQNPPENGFPLQLGFGTGWEGMTIGAPLKGDPAWRDTYRHFNLGTIPRSRGRRSVPPEDFPSSRRVIVRNRTEAIPLGWVWITWKER